MSVDHGVNYVRQSTDWNCWAASTAMMLGRGNDASVVTEMQTQYPDADWTDGATQPELAHVAAAYGFSQIYPVCQGPDGWEQWLANGPLLIQVPGNSHHSIVVAGIRTDPNVPDDAEVHVMDPWNGDLWLRFHDFESQYETAGSNWANNVYRR